MASLGTVALCDVSGYKIQQSINYQAGKKCPLPFAITFNYKHKLTADICTNTKTKTKSRCKYNNWCWQVIGDNRAIRCDLWQRKAVSLAPLGTNKHTPLTQYSSLDVFFHTKSLSQGILYINVVRRIKVKTHSCTCNVY